MKANKTKNKLKVSDSKTYRLKNGERTKNDGKSSRNHPQKCYGSVTEELRLDFSSGKRGFSPKIAKMHSLGVMNPFEIAPFPYL